MYLVIEFFFNSNYPSLDKNNQNLVVSTGSPTSSSSMSPASPKSRISIPVTTSLSSSQHHQQHQYLLKNRSPSPNTNIRFGSTNQNLPKRLSLNNSRISSSNINMPHSNSFNGGNDENSFDMNQYSKQTISFASGFGFIPIKQTQTSKNIWVLKKI